MRTSQALMLRRDIPWPWLALPLACVLLALPLPVRAQQDELPGRVGRISEVGGELFLAPEDRGSDWAPAGINYPVTTGDNLWVGLDGRAEVDFGGGQFRLAGETNAHVSRLDDSTFGLFVAQGRVHVRIRVLETGDVARIDTPNTQITLTRPGSYRIDVGADRQRTLLVVREGEALAQVAAGLQQVLPGQTATITGTDTVYADVRNGVALDGFDTWVADRDRRYERNRSTAYVSRQMVGYADLDEHGSWQTYPDYGPVWFPTTVAADWAPYRNGYWTTVGAYGPTWVDYAPWGYAPFHYGRWAYVGGRWGWCPGEYVARPYWAPALVGWVGGSRWTLTVAGGPVYGWVPLGWREPYRPAWNNCGSRCWNNYNKPYAVNVAERPTAPPTRYLNADRPGGMTAVHGAAFTGRKPVLANLVATTAATANAAPVLATAPVVTRPAPAEINAVRPGQRGTPPPASMLYATSKPARSVAPLGAGESVAVPQPRPQSAAPGGTASTSARPMPGTAMPAPYVAPSVTSARPAPGSPTAGEPGVAVTARPAPNSGRPSTGYVSPTPVTAAPAVVQPVPAQVYAPPSGNAKPPQGERQGGLSRQDSRVREAPPSGNAQTQPSTAPSMAVPPSMAARPAPAPAMVAPPGAAAPALRPAAAAPPVPAAEPPGGGKKPPAEARGSATGTAKEK